MKSPTEQRAWLPWLAWGLAAGFFFYAWVLRVNPSILINELMSEFGVGGAIVGHLSAFYFYGYAGGQIPAGILLDRFGPRRLLTIAAAVCASGAWLFAMADSLFLMSFARFMIGAGAAFSLLGSIQVAGQWLPTSRYAMLGGLAMGCGMAGGMVGQGPLRVVVDRNDWREVMVGVALAGFALALALYLTVRDRTRGSGGLRTALSGLVEVAKLKSNWLNAIAGLGVTGPLLGFGALWGVPYLQQALDLERAAAAGIASVTLAGMGVGAPFTGWLSDKLHSRRGPLMVGSCTSALALSYLLFAPLSAVGAGVACFVLGFSTSSQIVNFAFAREHNAPHLRATANGLINGVVTGAGALFQPAIGGVLDMRWSGALVDGVRVYSITDYQWALGLLFVALGSGFACAYALRE